MVNPPHGFTWQSHQGLLLCKKCGNVVGDVRTHINFHNQLDQLINDAVEAANGKTRAMRAASGYLPEDLRHGTKGPQDRPGNDPTGDATVHPGSEARGPTQG